MDKAGLRFLKAECEITLNTMGMNSNDPAAQNARRTLILTDAILCLINGGELEPEDTLEFSSGFNDALRLCNQADSGRSSEID